MKKSIKIMRGATLLEVMLVLAIAAMIIVMSIRYYQTAQANNQATAAMSQITGIVAAIENLSQNATPTINTATVTALMPANGMTTPWGTAITIGGTASQPTIIMASTPPTVCQLIQPKLSGKLTAPNCGTTAANMTVTYDRTM